MGGGGEMDIARTVTDICGPSTAKSAWPDRHSKTRLGERTRVLTGIFQARVAFRTRSARGTVATRR